MKITKRFAISFLSLVLLIGCFAGISTAAYAESSAPVAENLELSTYQNVSVGGSLSAYDPEGGSLEYTITTEPVKGSIKLESDGTFVYTPRENKRGRDYFGYKATDGDGNVSQEATVIIKIEKAKKDVLYSDMRGSADEYSAVLLAERDIFTGENVGGEYCFGPDKTVSRGEFLSMCMLVSPYPVLSGALTTGYADDAEIPAWMKGYVATAAMCGVSARAESGEEDNFDAGAPISESEAALMLDRAMNLTAVSYIPLDEGYDAETAQACANLSACGVLDESAPTEELLTRGEMAKMLSAAIKIADAR